MEFLKEILGEELFNQVTEKINAHNGDEANKEHQIKLANLGGGDYVGKAKYTTLEAEKNNTVEQLNSANALIEQLQKSAKGDDKLQGQITEYQSQVEKLTAELEQTKIDSAIKVGLLDAKATDVDYLTYKLKEKLTEKNETLELDESGNIKGWDEKLDALKTQLPSQFATNDGGKKGGFDGFKPIDKDNKGKQGMTKEDLLHKSYPERMKFFNEHPEEYNELMKD